MTTTLPAKRPITRTQFELVRPLLEGARKQTRPRIHDLYDVLCAIIHREQTGAKWRNLPEFAPPWRSVHEYHLQWSVRPRDGGAPILDQVLARLGIQTNDSAHG